MDQIRYQGYARERGFNPIQMSTASIDAIAQQGNGLLRQMQDNRETNRRNRDAYQAGMINAQNIEQQNRADNFNFEQRSRERFQEGVNQNLRQRVNDAANYQQNLDKQVTALSVLAPLSKTIGDIVVEHQKAKKQADEVAGQNTVFESGISYQDYLQLKSEEAKLDKADSAVNSVVNKLKASGTSDETIKQLRELSGYRLYGAMKQWAIQGGEDYGSFRAEIADKPFNVNGQEITLQQAAEGSPEIYSAVNALVRAEYLKQFQGLNQAFANEYLYDGMRRQEAKEHLMFSEKRSKELELDRQNTEMNDLLTRMAKPGEKGQGFINWINIASGGDSKELGEKRRSAIKYLVAAAQAGKFTAGDLAELESTSFLPNGSNKPELIGEKFAPDLIDLRKAVRDYNAQRRSEQDQALTDEKNAFEAVINQAASQRPLSKEEVRLAISEWQSRGYGAPPSWLKSMDTIEQLNDELGNKILLNKKVNGLLTTKELYSGAYSDQLIDRYKTFAQQQEQVSKDLKTTLYNALDAELKRSISTVDPKGYQQNADFFIAQGKARQMLNDQANTLISQGVAPTDAWNEASKDILKRIEAGQKGDGVFMLRHTSKDGKVVFDINNPGFTLASAGTSASDQNKRAAKIVAELSKGDPGKILFHTKILTEAEMQQLEGFRSGTGTIPTILWSIASRTKNGSVFDIADAQMKAYGRPEIQRPVSAQLYDTVRPEFRQLLTWRPSIDRTLRAVEGGTGGDAGNPYKPVLDLIASKESVSTDPKYNGYDALNRGGDDGGHTAIGSSTGTAVFRQPLTRMTVGQVIALGTEGKIFAAGRYQFIPTTLQGLVSRGAARPGDLFDEQTQDKIAVQLLREQTGQFWSGAKGVGQYVSGLGHTWIGLQKLKPQQIVQAMEQARSNLQGYNVDPSRLKPQVAYRVGSIGPTSTGPHLHVMDATGAYFNRNELDKYVAFKLPQGVVPVSSGVTVNGGKFGAGRDYGAHNGWDYAVPDGTQVVLRNGARIISKKPSDNGDMLTIALPDGRRFTFLHGKAS